MDVNELVPEVPGVDVPDVPEVEVPNLEGLMP